jgi:hypothetical protein
MNQQLAGLNIDIVFATKKQALSTITPDFFSGAGIVDGEIELVSQPVLAKNFARMELVENIVIVGEPNRIVFSEAMVDKKYEKLVIPAMARKYTQTLPNLEYEAIGINIRGFLSFPDSQDAASRYIASNFLAAGTWQAIGTSPMRASINLVFQLERAPLYLSIAEAAVKQADETTTPIVMFSGSFSYTLNGESASEKLAYMHECIGNWQADFAAFTDIINNHFLAQTATNSFPQLPHIDSDSVVSPDIFAMSGVA